MNAVVLSREQAATFAAVIAPNIKNYIKEHRSEYEAWLKQRNEPPRRSSKEAAN